MILENAKYTQDHEWVLLDNDIATVGITNFAVDELGDIVFVELPVIGTEFSQMDELGTVESVKTVSSLYSPISGAVTESNELLTNSPETINESPYGDGWLVKVKLDNQTEYDDLMSASEYEAYLQTL